MRLVSFVKVIKRILDFTNNFHFEYSRTILESYKRFIKITAALNFKAIQHPDQDFHDQNARNSLDLSLELSQRFGSCRLEKYGITFS